MGVILRHFQMEPLHVFMTMPEASASLFNLGIYSVAEAARLTGVSTSRIRRWLRGYRFKSRGRRYATDALWHGQLDPIEGKLALGFLDLMEVRFVDAFPKRGISWPTIHKTREKAMAHFPNATHPFCTEKFLTNGRGLLVEVQEETGEQALLDITKDQKVFDALVRPFARELEFGPGDVLERWWPMGREHRVALDPARDFGQPTLFTEGVSTQVIARSVKANDGSVARVAEWYEIPVEAVQDAVEFEERLLTA